MDKEREEGVITEILPDGRYRITMDGGKEIIAYVAGKMRVHKIRLILNDRVAVELDPYGGKATNRIVRRL